jgi:hypothetical protein
VDLEGITPITDDSRAGDGPVDSHCRARDSIWAYGGVLQAQPILPDHSSVRASGVVIIIHRPIAPTAPSRGSIARASSTRSERTVRIRRAGSRSQGEEKTENSLHDVGVEGKREVCLAQVGFAM